MHAGLALVAVLCALSGAALILMAALSITFYGIPPQFEVAFAVIIMAVAIIAAWMLYKGLQANNAKVKTGLEALVGAAGVAVTDLNPDGEIRVLGEFWQATSKDEPVQAGDKVVIVAMEGMFLVVKPAEEKFNSSGM